MPTLTDHPRPEELVSFYERELSPADDLAIQVHVVTCTQCLGTIEKIASAANLLDSNGLVHQPVDLAQPAPAPPLAVTSRIRARVVRLLDHIGQAIAVRPRIVWVATLSVVIAAFLYFQILLHRSPSSKTPQLAESRRPSVEPKAPDLNRSSESDAKAGTIARSKTPVHSVKPRLAGRVASFVLMPAVRGNGNINIVNLHSGSRLIELDVLLKSEPSSGSSATPVADVYATYRARVQTVNGREILLNDNLRKKTLLDGRPAVELIMNSKLLTPGDYVLLLSGVDQLGKSETIAGYGFRVR